MKLQKKQHGCFPHNSLGPLSTPQFCPVSESHLNFIHFKSYLSLSIRQGIIKTATRTYSEECKGIFPPATKEVFGLSHTVVVEAKSFISTTENKI